MRKLPMVALVVLAAFPLAAMAVPLSFDFTNGTDSIMFEIDSNPVPDFVNIPGENFVLVDVPGTFNGTDLIIDAIAFFTEIGSGLDITINGELGAFFGPAVIQGPLDAPTIIPGSYFGFIANCAYCTDPSDFSLEITAVSEPGRLGLLAIGLLSIGLLRVRTRAPGRGLH